MDRRKYFIGEGFGIRPEVAVAVLKSALHPFAAPEISGLTYGAVIEWVRDRLEKISVRNGEQAFWILNPWNENGLGLQSASFEIIRGDQAVLSPDEWRAPTVGVITRDLVDDPCGWAIARFGVEDGHAECITALSDSGLRMDTVGPYLKAMPSILPVGQSITIAGPNQVLTVLEVNNPRPEDMCEIANNGVYGCLFLRGAKE